jgi:hypothetical protein
MSRTCAVCTHSNRAGVDLALVNGLSNRRAASLCDVSEAAIRRHREHLPSAMVEAKAAEQVTQADDLLSQVMTLKARAVGILDAAEREGKYVPALMAIREAQGCIELLAELANQIDRRPTLNLLIAPEWLAARAALLEALAPFPEARSAVSARLLALETSA